MFEGVARVFEDEEAVSMRRNRITLQGSLVIRNEGPVAVPACARCLRHRIYLRAGMGEKGCARHRRTFSGRRVGCASAMSRGSLVGGPLALVRDGDRSASMRLRAAWMF